MPQSQDPFYAGLGQAVRIGTELLAALIVGGGLGWAVDTYLLETGPWGLVLGCGGRREECLSNGATVAPVTA
jgi:ATP synthase protein I